MNDPLVVSLSVSVYRGLLRTYPRRFRQEYGEAMAQVFRDLCLQPGEAGLAGVWGHTLLDYAMSLVFEHMDRGVEMTRSKWIQLSGWGMAASGFLMMIGYAAQTRPTYNPYNAAAWPIDPLLNAVGIIFFTAALILMTAGMAGLLARFREQVSGLGLAGLVIGIIAGAASTAGAAGLSIFESGPWWDIFLTGLLGINLGMALFGIDCLRQRLFARWNGLPLMFGVGFLAFGLTGLEPFQVDWPIVVVLIVLLVFALGLGLIGYRLQSEPSGHRATISL